MSRPPTSSRCDGTLQPPSPSETTAGLALVLAVTVVVAPLLSAVSSLAVAGSTAP